MTPHNAVLCIGRNMWLLPYKVDDAMAKNLVASLVGAREIDRKVVYGPETPTDPHGCNLRQERLVVEMREEDVSLMAFPLGAVVGPEKWAEIKAEVAAAAETQAQARDIELVGHKCPEVQ